MNAVAARNKEVAAAVALDSSFCQWKARFDPELALAFVRRCQACNKATRKNLVTLIKKINERVPKLDYGPCNPNTGLHSHFFEIGSEGSRVIYLCLDTWATGPSVRWQAVLKDIEQYAKDAKCDEFRVSDDPVLVRFPRVRIWWD